MMAIRLLGLFLKPALFHNSLQANSPLSELILYNLDVAPFKGTWIQDEVITMAYLTYYGRSLVQNRPVAPDRTILYVSVMAELIGLPTNMFLETSIAQRNFRRAVKALVHHHNLGIVSTNNLQNYSNSIQTTPDLYPAEPYGEHAATDINLEDETPITTYVRILRHVALGATRKFKLGGLDVIANIIVAKCKRGTISDQFVQKIEASVGFGNIITLNPQAIPIYYSNFGTYVSAENYIEVFQRWAELIPPQNLRLLQQVQRIAGSGLTSFITVGKAIRMYPDFNWGLIAVIMPEDIRLYTAAVPAVNGNIYYGFNSDLGAAKSTLYKNLAYVAKELLIKVGGESALKRYSGWTQRVPYQARVDAAIADYMLGRGRIDGKCERIRNDVFENLRDLVNAPGNTAIFA